MGEIMCGPFFVGQSMASENIEHLIKWKGVYHISDYNITMPPEPGDNWPMKQTHGENWIAWQDVWVHGLEELNDMDVYVLSAFDEFKEKFKKDETRPPRKIFFDNQYKLEGQTARNILDWERRQLLR